MRTLFLSAILLLSSAANAMCPVQGLTSDQVITNFKQKTGMGCVLFRSVNEDSLKNIIVGGKLEVYLCDYPASNEQNDAQPLYQFMQSNAASKPLNSAVVRLFELNDLVSANPCKDVVGGKAVYDVILH